MEHGTIEQFDTDTIMREVVSRTYRDMWDSCDSGAREIIEQYTVTDGDYSDAIAEWADGLVPAYYSEQVREWYAIGLPDLSDSGLSGGGVWGEIGGALYEWYTARLVERVEFYLDGGEVA